LIVSLGGADDSLIVLFSFAVAFNSPETVLGCFGLYTLRACRSGFQIFGEQKGTKNMSISGSEMSRKKEQLSTCSQEDEQLWVKP
jgi:hypothetical protein